MPIEEKTEIETRFEEFTDVLRKSGASLIELENGKTLEEAINDLKEGVGKKSLNEEVPPAIDAVTIEKYELLEQRIIELEEKLANMSMGGTDIDLKKEFSSELLVEKTDLKLDEIKPAISPEILNKALKLNTSKLKKGEKLVEDFPYPPGRTIENKYPPLTIVDWLRPKSDTSKFLFSGRTVDNSFDTANPVQDGKVEKGAAKKSAPTGGGKSTLLLRCGAFHALDNEEIKVMTPEQREKLGVTLVVPEKSLTGSVLSGHDDWLSNEAAALESIEKMKQRIANGEKKNNGEPYTEEDIDYRVIKCPFCDKKHTEIDGKPYETVENGPSNMISVFY